MKPDELAEYPVVVPLPVQWGDQDVFGHVNNVVYFRWFESARVGYWLQVGMERADQSAEFGPILASVRCDYRRQLRFPDSVLVGASITRLGRSSLTMVHRVYSESQRATVAEGESTIVYFSYARQQSEPIPEDIRQRVAQLEGRRR